MQVAVLLFASNQIVSCFLLPPQNPILPPQGHVLSTPCVPVASQPASSHMQRILPYAAYATPVQPNAAHRQPNAPPRCPISAPMLPCGQPDSTICSVFCNMLHMQRLCSPQATKYTPQASNISPEAALWPTSQRPYAAYIAIRLHMKVLCSQMQLTGDQMHLPDVSYQRLCSQSQSQCHPRPPTCNPWETQLSPKDQKCCQTDTKQHPKCSNASMQLWKT